MIKTVSDNSIPGTYGIAFTRVDTAAQISRPVPSDIQRNSSIEKAVIEHIADHPAAKVVMSALVEALTGVFVKAQGEIKGWAEIVQAASRPHDSNRKGNGVLSARFDVMGCVGWNAATIRATCRVGTLREKGTLFTNLMLSDNFKRILERSMTDPALQRKLEGLVDLDYLKTTDGNLYAMSGWAARASESREQIGKAAFQSASNLGSAQISARELAFHRHNPVNHPSNQARVGFGISSPASNDLQVLRGHGNSVWKVKSDSDFARQASASGKPVIAGPSGTASRFMAVARFISPGCLRGLGLDSEQAFKELVRYACYGYFGQDDHHSMLEVNLGTAPHGLDEQWDDKLYTEPFSHVIMGRGFSVDNAAQQHIVARATDEPVEHSAADRVG
ncbi:hypothetical protein [Pseudomonas syringae group genomosp. 3]|uniref:hypothetical protein n=1 Tax=Pseudomonas syringae group genomosp. 3 TaxID=251701 RepID=UPI0005CA07EA|nr:hypothetical protein [Pseudomonas syringae group genomosp. 3]KPB72280.1 Type III effector HopT1-2 [Pseudomonas syringae pv. maculicola str. M6]KPX71153.1 Type III effector HopT1-2 [Pseudomonas syringae pv. maculicola]